MAPGKPLAIITILFVAFFASMLFVVLNPWEIEFLYSFQPAFIARDTGKGTFILYGDLVDHLGVTLDGALVADSDGIIWAGKKVALNPGNVPAIDTESFIYPGFIDSHNHPSYNILPPWRPGRKFNNRYEWARIGEYDEVTAPRKLFTKKLRDKVIINRYAEVRALISGTTMIQGMRKLAGIRTLVRNLDSYNRCKEDTVSTAVHPMQPREKKRAKSIIEKMEQGKTTRHLIHLGEGVDDESWGELGVLADIGLLRPETQIIHGTGFREEDFKRMKKNGVNLIWSPQSNLVCYGACTRADTADRVGLIVSLAPDWTLTGSDNILDELKVAWKVNEEQFGGYFSEKDLFEMITIRPARICGFEEYLGSLRKGYEADFAVIDRVNEDPFRNLLSVEVSDVKLVAIKGEPFYGLSEWLDLLGKNGDYETLEVQGFVRAIDVTEEDVTEKVPYNDLRLFDIVSEIKSRFPELHPLARDVGFPEHPFQKK